MNCPVCSTEMKSLFTSNYCPNDCDRHPVKVAEGLSLDSIEVVLRNLINDLSGVGLIQPNVECRMDEQDPNIIHYNITWVEG